MRAALRAGKPFQGEAVNYRKDRSAYVVEWLITPVREADGRITHWVSAQRDITERRHGEDRQALMVRELHHRVKEHPRHRAGGGERHGALLALRRRVHPGVLGRIGSLARTHA